MTAKQTILEAIDIRGIAKMASPPSPGDSDLLSLSLQFKGHDINQHNSKGIQMYDVYFFAKYTICILVILVICFSF